ncbi:N-acetyllactosaminide beta-1,3-N-acetylglucosaminyltransferase 2 [Carcharodon carcharias]|uniref:N-acetyllactosaminide beta-1,3-N-acetylglucosaminyltransferase 2 n=1 Tax=Carcharodon carcharias TaxID=13397 RepID=UPI001B7F1A83|nr:N-acetyllactosaminide beta-1,3-N-acetylglucosaminyltransferase 2 [Carcharodon carcharias]
MNLTQKKCLLWAAWGLLTNLAIFWALWSRRRAPAPEAGPRLRLRLGPGPGPGPGGRPPGAFWKPECPLPSVWNREQAILARGAGPPEAGEAPVPAAGALLPPRQRCRPDTGVAGSFVDFQHLPQQMKDFLLYRRCRAYPLVLEPRAPCRGRPGTPRLLLAIKSQASSFARRQAIRQTWGSGQAGGRLLFLLGQQRGGPPDGHPDLRGLLRYESRRHGDLLQWAFRDTFFNLTLKEVLFLPWLVRRCPGARFVFKGDDDVFVNTGRLLDYLAALGPGEARDLFLGDAILGAAPARDPALKYYVPGAFYRGLYPPYAGGAGVLYSGRLARRLARAARAVPLFPIDDVYTGMCLQRLGLAPTPHPGFRSFGINASDRWDPCAYQQLFMVHRRSPQEMVQLWRLLRQPNITCQ